MDREFDAMFNDVSAMNGPSGIALPQMPMTATLSNRSETRIHRDHLHYGDLIASTNPLAAESLKFDDDDSTYDVCSADSCITKVSRYHSLQRRLQAKISALSSFELPQIHSVDYTI